MEDQNQSLLEETPPSKHVERIKFLAKVLAYGAREDKWSTRFTIDAWRKLDSARIADGDFTSKLIGEKWIAQGHPTYKQNLEKYLHEKWNYLHPQACFLETFGYLERRQQKDDSIEYLLTPKSLALLDEPRFKKVFISYRRQESSAFALLLHDRLKQALFEPFIDLRSIEPGERFKQFIEAEIEASEVFICLVGKTTLESEYVKDEINHAIKHTKWTIAIWHHGFNYDEKASHDEDLQLFLDQKNAIRVLPEDINGYEGAINQLMQFLHSPKMEI